MPFLWFLWSENLIQRMSNIMLFIMTSSHRILVKRYHIFFLNSLPRLILLTIVFFCTISSTEVPYSELNWSSSYHSPRSQSLYVNGYNYTISALLTCGILQGSMLSSLLFTWNITTIVWQKFLIKHFYDDDLQFISHLWLVDRLCGCWECVQPCMVTSKLLSLNHLKLNF